MCPARPVVSSAELLLVGFEEPTRESVLEGAGRAGYGVTEAGSGPAALELTARSRYDAIVVSHPLRVASTAGFLSEVRRAGSPCRSSGVVLVAPERWRGDAEGFIGRGANRVLTTGEVVQSLSGTLRPLLRVAPRTALRLPVRIEVRSSAGVRTLLCETVNLSVRGALVRVRHTFPVGTAVRFQIFLPGSGVATGAARIVRHSVWQREPFPAVAVEFEALENGSEALLAGRLEAPRGLVQA